MRPKLLLHACCAPCSGFLACELSRDFDVAIYYDNSNIFPEAEYQKRRQEAADFFTALKISPPLQGVECDPACLAEAKPRRTCLAEAKPRRRSNNGPCPGQEANSGVKRPELAEGVGVEFIEAGYNHGKWLGAIKGLEREPERGRRCRLCYEFRLRHTAELARSRGFAYFASTLAISPHKDAQAINELGEAIGQEIGVKFIAGDWKKQDGFKNAMAHSRRHNFYRQNYCGCEFSRP